MTEEKKSKIVPILIVLIFVSFALGFGLSDYLRERADYYSQCVKSCINLGVPE